jgi:hypothetical protein
MGKVDATDGQNHFGLQLFVAHEAAGGHYVTHRLFDFALRGDADFFQEFAQARVENIFVMARSSTCMTIAERCPATISRFRTARMRADPE